MLERAQIEEALRAVQDPELHKDLVSLGMVRDVTVDDGRVAITLALTTLACPLKGQIVEDVRKAVVALQGAIAVDVQLTEMTGEERERALGRPAGKQEAGMAEPFNHIQHVIAVMSGKGGVGKSLVTVGLAVEMRRRGLRVGILDADITGPSIPKLLGLTEQPRGGPLGLNPVKTKTGMAVMSINLLLPQEDEAVIWRGPLIAGAVKQFWGDVFWGDLDYLLVDLPPGTGDVALTVMQSLPLDGIVLVTSPQALAGMVVRKAANMATQLKVPILGVVENMSYAECPQCGEKLEVLGPSHLTAICVPFKIPVLGRIPLHPDLARLSDEGRFEEHEFPWFKLILEQVLLQVPEASSTKEVK